MTKKINIAGQRFGKLVVIKPAKNRGDFTRWECQCDCGTKIVTYTNGLRSGHTKSCGCLQKQITKERSTVHGHHNTQTYFSWVAMIQRCTNPKNIAYRWYGARGITVCKRWRTFSNFLIDMGVRPAGKTIDRIKNEIGYRPGNCRWSTRAVQDSNKHNGFRDARGSNNGNNKLTEKIVLRIKKLLRSDMRGIDIARQFDVTKTTISRIKLGKNWKHVKEKFNEY
jgi:hypothetical protein